MYNLGNRLRLLKDYLARRPVVSGLPFHLTIESTNHCNLQCPMCNRHRDPMPHGNMPMGRFKRIIDQTAGRLEFLWPYGEGEPLLNDEIYEMISYAKQKGIAVELSTNATLLSDGRIEKLLASGLDRLVIGFDGATKETYEKCRPGADFAGVRARIQRLLELKKASKFPLQVILQMVLLKENEDEVGRFRSLWRIPGVDGIRLKEDQLKYDNLRASIYRRETSRRRLPCFLLWRGPLFVRHDGTVIPCCRFPGKRVLGDLERFSFQEFWNSGPMQDLRRAHATGALNGWPMCMDCTVPHPTLAFVISSFLAGPLLISRLLPLVERAHLFWGITAFQNSYGSGPQSR